MTPGRSIGIVLAVSVAPWHVGTTAWRTSSACDDPDVTEKSLIINKHKALMLICVKASQNKTFVYSPVQSDGQTEPIYL